MLRILKQSKGKVAVTLAAILTLAACGDAGGPPELPGPSTAPPAPQPPIVARSYEVTVTNLTNAQPLSPVAVVLHESGQLFSVGDSASEELEYLAEGGDNSFILGLPVVEEGVSGAAPIGPGASETIEVSILDNESPLISVLTMLVNTNDAFTGINARSLADMAVGDSFSVRPFVYDSGTEANNEAFGTIPGPVDGGTGFDPMRDDVDFVAMHPGVVTSDDGLAESVLTQAHRFDNPTARITVTRTQ